MRANNCIMIQGNLGADPEMITTTTGMVIAKLRVAVKRHDKEKNTDWIPVTFFGKKAELAAEYLKKGSSVSIVGSIKTEIYEKDGQKKSFFNIDGGDFQLGSKKDNEGGGAPSYAAPKGERPAPKKSTTYVAPTEDEDEDDIPPF